jgi:hypothetical protein
VWFVRGYIAQEKGKNINWARAVALITRKKARREKVHILKSGGSMELLKFNGAEEVLRKLYNSLHALKLEEP